MQKQLRSFLLFAGILCLASCFSMTEEDVIKYSVAKSSEYTETEKTLNPPATVTVLGKELTQKMVTNFTSMDEVESQWNSPNYRRRGPNFWSEKALSIKEDYLEIATKQVKFREMGIPFEESYKTEWKIADENSDVIISGAIETNNEKLEASGVSKPLKYGFYVARLRLNKETNGHWHAFWTYNDQYEFDIFEFHKMDSSFPKNQSFDQTTHYHHGESRHSYRHYESVEDVAQWNTYALLWTPDEYVYYVNWKPTYFVSETGGDSSPAKKAALERTGHKLIPDTSTIFFFSTEVAKGLTWAEAWAGFLDESKLPDSMDVDYFACYTHPDWEKLVEDWPVKKE